MKFKKIIYFVLIFFSFSFIKLSADTPHFIDFKYILNESEAGKKAQTFLKKRLDNGFKTIKENSQMYFQFPIYLD